MEADLTLHLPEMRRFNRVVIQEDIADHSQRVARHQVDAWIDGGWKTVAQGETVGYKRILRFDPVESNQVRIRILDSRVCPTVSRVGLYLQVD